MPVSEFIVMEILKEGQLKISSLVKSFKSLPENEYTLFHLESAFMELHMLDMIAVSYDLSNDTFQDQLDKDEIDIENPKFNESRIKELFTVATKVKTEGDVPPAKRVKTSSDPSHSQSVHFRLNFEKADQILRDRIMTASLKKRFADDSIADVAESLTRLSSVLTDPASPMSCSVSVDAIARDLASTSLTGPQVQSCLDVLVEDTECGIKPVERLAGGGMYGVDVLKIMTKIVGSAIAAMIEQKYGGRYARVFRILLTHGSLPQKVVEEKALMPPKDCKEIIFTLVQEGYVKTNYYSRSVDYAPTKTHFLFSIDLEQVARRAIGVCSHAIVSAIKRRSHEYDKNRLLIERKVHVDQQVAILEQESGTEQQVDDLRSTFTGRDLELVAAAESAFRKLQLAEMQVEETLFILHSWLKLKHMADTIKG